MGSRMTTRAPGKPAATRMLPTRAQGCSCKPHRPHGTCPSCRERRARLSRKGVGHVALEGHRREQVLAVLRSSGRSLDVEARADLEPLFQRDFGRVRVHDDPQAADTAARLNASAYTVGRHIVFAPGRYAPTTPEGRKLLAHELAHVVQQERVADVAVEDLTVGAPDDALEREADRAADLVLASRTIEHGAPGALSAPVIQRDSCGPDVTEQIKNTWQRIQFDFHTRWDKDQKKKMCDYLLAPIVPKDPDNPSIRAQQWNTDAFDTLPLFHLSAIEWLTDRRVVAAGCGVPTTPDKTDAKIYENPKYCSMGVQVKDQCWLSGTVNYGTYGIMCKLCNDFAPPLYWGIYYKATALLYAYKQRIFARDATTKEEDISIPHSWFKATYDGGPGAVSPKPGNKSSNCPCLCPLTGSIVQWDYVWEPTKRRDDATPPGVPDLSASGNMPAPVPPSASAGRRR